MVEQLLRMSLTAGIVILVVILIRALMRKLPKKFSYMLWAAVGFRLLCPVSIESKFSILNAKPAAQATAKIENSRAYTNIIRHTSPAAHMHMQEHPVGQVQQVVTPDVTETAAKASSVDIHTVMMVVWAVIAALIVGYAVYHLVRLKFKMRDAKKVEKGIYESPLVTSPFAMGLIHPGIYLPVDLPEFEREYLIEHERTHIRRGDLIFKMIAVTALAIHWFNPLVWVAFVLFCRDMEMSCDEIVLEKLGVDIRKNYSLSLVTLASKSQDYSYVVMPTSFSKSSVGKTEVKMRIKNIMSFKKSSRSVAALAGMIVIAVMLTCVLNACAPVEDKIIESATTHTAASSRDEDETEEVTELSSSDEIDGQSEYMLTCYEWSERYGDNYSPITDPSVFEDDALRELAQYYLDQGYTLGCGTYGDTVYCFEYGFYACIDGESVDHYIWVYKMNEALFDHYFVERTHSYEDDVDEITDDGTVIRYVDNSNLSHVVSVSEYNRDTGIGTYGLEYLNGSGSALTDDPTINEIARQYEDAGYNISCFDPEDDFRYEIDDYPYGIGVRAFWQDQENCIEHYIYIFEGDEDIFESLISSEDLAGVIVSSEDNGTILTVTSEKFDFGIIDTIVFEFDRSTGIITINYECPYVFGMSGGTMGACTDDEFDALIADHNSEYGDPISTEDDGRLVRVVYPLDGYNLVVIYDTEQHMVAETYEHSEYLDN